jgi:MscS family membrane protein
MKTLIRGLGALFVLLTVFAGAVALAQEEPTLREVIEADDVGEAAPAPAKEGEPAAAPTPPPPPQIGPLDDFDRGVPRTAVEGFTQAAEERDWERASNYLDLRRLPPGMSARQGPELARKLNIVLERALWIDFAMLSRSPEGHEDDGLPSYRDRVGVIETPQGKIEILLQRVPREDDVRVWKFSNRTVARIPLLYAQYGHGRLGEALAAFLPEFGFLGLESWQWVGMISLALGAWILAWAVTRVVGSLLVHRETPLRRQAARLATGGVRFLAFVLLFREGIDRLAPTLELRALMGAKTLLTIAIAWVVVRVADFLFDLLDQRLERQRLGSSVLVRPMKTATRIAVVLVAGLMWLQNVGFSVTAVLAGLGIGGIAVALAAQKSLADVFGAITLYSGRAIGIGDFCRFAGILGTVEEIGLRWTRVRTLDHTVVSVPNGEFAKMPLENFAARGKIWYHPKLRLRYETTPDQLRYVLVEVRKLFYSHPKVLADPARIRFVGFGDCSLDLDVFAYLDTTDYGEYLEIAEDLHLRIMGIVLEAGSGFAMPSRTNYVETGSGLDGERARAAEASVERWREKGELYLPSFPDERIDELRGSLPYPPEGAPARASSG